jgi:2-polyprenyl-3-methyl-5-hydroxy-6-metoxy-1,4-benzoquinol methylase
VQRLICTDIDEETLADNRARLKEFSNIAFEYFDFRQAPYPAAVEGVYLIDVLEHVFPEEEDTFLDHVARSLVPHGIGLLGTPNASSEPYASAHSKTGHVNWKSGEQLRALAQRFFHNVFMFGMNDEVIHTGFLPMSHYLLALCVGPRVAR